MPTATLPTPPLPTFECAGTRASIGSLQGMLLVGTSVLSRSTPLFARPGRTGQAVIQNGSAVGLDLDLT